MGTDERYGHLAIWALPHLLDFRGDNSPFLQVDKTTFFLFFFFLFAL